MNNQGDMMEALMPIIILAAFFIGMHFFYQYNAIPINTSALFIAEAILTPFSFISDGAQEGLSQVKKADPAKMDWDKVVLVLSFTGTYLRWLVIPFIAFLGYKGMKYGIKSKWMRRMMFRDLLKNNVSDFPSIAPAVKLDILSMEQYKGPWRVADTFIKWTDDHNLLVEKSNGDKYKKVDLSTVFRDGWIIISRTKREHDPANAILNKKKAKHYFDEQLGELMPDDILELPAYIKGLAAAFYLFIHAERPKAYELLGQLSLSYDSTDDYNYEVNEVGNYYVDIAGVDEILSDSKYTGNNSRVILQHSDYIYTWLTALLTVARTSGELASSRFIWLRPVDRTLWYSLNQLGGRMPHAEAVGVWAHMAAEAKLKKSLSPPETIQAVKSLEFELRKERWLPALKREE